MENCALVTLNLFAIDAVLLVNASSLLSEF
jgi:hypothetical protein